MTVIIVGGGKVGSYLATLLLAEGHRAIVIEERAEHLDALRRDLPVDAVVHGSGTDPLVLERTGVRHADVVAAVTGTDETNLVVASLARFEFHVPRVITRVNNPRNAWMFTPEMGVDVALNQADVMARLIEEEMSLGDMMTLLKLHRGQYAIVEERVHPAAATVGKPLREIRWPPECAVTAIIRKGQLLIPRGETVLQADDEVLALVHASEARAVAALLGSAGPAPGLP
jgi:trk system potassium uptake protein TrkA